MLAQQVLGRIPSPDLFLHHPLLPYFISLSFLIHYPHSLIDLGVITVIIVTILATTFFEHLGFTEHHAKGFLYIISFDYHNDPVNWVFFN